MYYSLFGEKSTFMKSFKILILFAVCVIASLNNSQAQTIEKLLTPKIKSVTVFLSSAEINCTATTNISAGVTDLIIYGLPTSLNENSISVSGLGDFTILNVSNRFNYLREDIKKPIVKKLEDSLENVGDRLQLEYNKKFALEQEESLLLANKSIGGDNVGVSLVQLKLTADFFRERLAAIRNLIAKSNKKIPELINLQTKITSQINQENANQNLTTTEVRVSVAAKNSTTATINLSFVANGAGWTPKYDLRSAGVKSPIDLLYKADVYQQTGMDWNNVKLTLSTLNPEDKGIKSELYPQFLSFFQPNLYLEQSKDGDNIRSLPTRSINAAVATSAGVYKAEGVYERVQAYQTTLSRNFEIGIPYSVPSGGQTVTVEIQKYKILTVYSHAVVPKIDNSVYLLGYISNWEDYNLLQGMANIYFEGVYIGETSIDPSSTKDTLSVSLGKDKGVITKREKVKDLDSEKTIGTNKKQSYTYEIEIRNTKNVAIDLVLEDQLPIVSDNSIEVKSLELNNGSLIKETGKITWKLKLAPAETKKIRFSYEVKYPKDSQITGLD